MKTKEQRDGLRKTYSIPVWEVIDEMRNIPMTDFLTDVQKDMIDILDELDALEKDIISFANNDLILLY